MKKSHVFGILVAIVIVFLILVAAIDPLRIAVKDALEGAGGSTFIALENGWASIVANPLYQQLHVFIWFFGGMIFLGALIVADRKNKIPLLRNRHKKLAAPVMGPPQTILVTAAPARTAGENTQAATAPVVVVAETPPVDQNKTAGGT